MKPRKIRLFILVIGIAFFCSSPAHAGGGGGMPTGAMETTQLRNEAELVSANATFVKQLSQQIDQLKTQINMYSQMMKNAIPLTVKDIFNLNNELKELANIAQDVNGLYNGAKNMQSYLENEYNSLKNIQNYKTVSEIQNFQKSLDQKHENTLRASAKLMDTLTEQEKNRAKAINNAVDASRNAQGTQQALQAGNELAAATASQLITLSDLMKRQIRMMEDKEIREQQQREADRKLFELQHSQKSTAGQDMKFEDFKLH